MSTYLLIDIGAGTMDILYWDDASALHFKAVVRSPVPHLAGRIKQCPGDVLITGQEMGGGNITGVLKERALTPSCCHYRRRPLPPCTMTRTELRRGGFRWSRKKRRKRCCRKASSAILLRPISTGTGWKTVVKGLGVPFEFDVVGICAQDHGVPPKGVSHLDFRHRLFTAVLDEDPHAAALLYEKDEVPQSMNRLRSVARSAEKLPAKEVFVMDSGMAAIQGASLDSLAQGQGVCRGSGCSHFPHPGCHIGAWRNCGLF